MRVIILKLMKLKTTALNYIKYIIIPFILGYLLSLLICRDIENDYNDLVYVFLNIKIK